METGELADKDGQSRSRNINSSADSLILQGIPVRPDILTSIYNSPYFFSGSVWVPDEFMDPHTASRLASFNKFLVVQRHDFFHGVIQPDYVHFLQRELDVTTEISQQLFPVKLSWMLNREYQKWYVDYAKPMDISTPHHDWYVENFGSFVPSPLEPLYWYCDRPSYVILIIMIALLSIGILWRNNNNRKKSRGSRFLCCLFYFDLVGRVRAFLAGRAHPILKSFPKPLPVQLLKDRDKAF